MSDREIIIEMAGDLKTLKDRPPCPSPQCFDHSNRLRALEDKELERKTERRIVYLICGFVSGGSVLIVFIMGTILHLGG